METGKQQEDYSVVNVIKKLHELAITATDLAFSIHANALDGFDELCLKCEEMEDILNFLHAALILTPQCGLTDYREWARLRSEKKPDGESC